MARGTNGPNREAHATGFGTTGRFFRPLPPGLSKRPRGFDREASESHGAAAVSGSGGRKAGVESRSGRGFVTGGLLPPLPAVAELLPKAVCPSLPCREFHETTRHRRPKEQRRSFPQPILGVRFAGRSCPAKTFRARFKAFENTYCATAACCSRPCRVCSSNATPLPSPPCDSLGVGLRHHRLRHRGGTRMHAIRHDWGLSPPT